MSRYSSRIEDIVVLKSKRVSKGSLKHEVKAARSLDQWSSGSIQHVALELCKQRSELSRGNQGDVAEPNLKPQPV